jgi:hypothetical protein
MNSRRVSSTIVECRAADSSPADSGRRATLRGRADPWRHRDGRRIQRPAAEKPVEWAPPQWAEAGRLRDAAPENLQGFARARGAALREAVDQDGRIHRPGRRAGNAIDFKPGLFQKPVEHPPRERTVRAAALQAMSTRTERRRTGLAVSVGTPPRSTHPNKHSLIPGLQNKVDAGKTGKSRQALSGRRPRLQDRRRPYLASPDRRAPR